jgi:hypothetical protein
MIEKKELFMNKTQQNTKTRVELNDFLGDAAEIVMDGVLEGSIDMATEVEAEVVGETVVELAGEVTETVGEGAAEGILEGIFDGLDDVPGLVIAGIALIGVGVVAGLGFLGHKLLKKKK